MSDIQDRISRARTKGYSDDEIWNALSKHGTYAERIAQARESGYSDNAIRKALFGAAMEDQAAQTSAAKPGKSVGKFIGNAYESGKNLIGGIAEAVTSPLQTAQGIGKLALGTVGNAAALVNPESDLFSEYRGASQAFGDMYAQRYGGIDNLLQTLYEDPFGVAADVASLTGLAGGGLGVASKAAQGAGLGRTAGALAKGAKVANIAAQATDPISLMQRAGVATGNAAIRGANAVKNSGVAERLYQSALKPSLAKKNLPSIQDQIATGLREGIPVSKQGAEKIAQNINELKDISDAFIKEATIKGVGVNPGNVTKRLDSLTKRYSQQVNPIADIKAINQVRAEFEDVMRKSNINEMPASLAQEIKRNTYKTLRKKYGEETLARYEAQKALARGLKEELATAIPELSPVNARMSDLLGLQKQMEKAVSRISNREIFGLGTQLAAGAAVGAITHQPAMVASILALKLILGKPEVKSKIAIAIHNARLRNPIKFTDRRAYSAISRVNEYVNSLDEFIAAQGGVSDEETTAAEPTY